MTFKEKSKEVIKKIAYERYYKISINFEKKNVKFKKIGNNKMFIITRLSTSETFYNKLLDVLENEEKKEKK